MHDTDVILTEGEEFAEFELEEGLDDPEEDEAFEAEDDFDLGDELELEDGAGRPYGLLSESEETELASELLNVTSDAELDEFLGKLFRRVSRGVRGLVRRGSRFLKSRVGRRLVRVLRKAARRALPLAGTYFGGPVGGGVASAAGRIFGLELEGLDPEEEQLEMARRTVRLAADAMVNSARGARDDASPDEVVRRAMALAARRHAPGLLRRRGRAVAGSSGRWYRRGNRIVVVGL